VPVALSGPARPPGQRAPPSKPTTTIGRVLRTALRLTNASMALDVPPKVMARLMRLRADGTSDGNAVVLKRMVRALEDAASRSQPPLPRWGRSPGPRRAPGGPEMPPPFPSADAGRGWR